MPSIDDYYEPWTYDYQTLIDAPLSEHDPVARPFSQLTGDPIEVKAGPNWDDDLAGAPEHAVGDPLLKGIEEQVKLAYEHAFMFYLPRICEHCLNPSCVASCPSGAMYKRDEDGIVLVDQDKCRGWRFCVSGCPYKKVYFNHRTGKAEKCTLCYPRIEAGPADRSARRPASAGSATSASSSTTPIASRPPRPCPTSATCSTRSWASSSTQTTPRCRAGRPRRRHPRGLARGGAALARLHARHPLPASRCRCTPSTGRCRWSGTCRRSRRW